MTKPAKPAATKPAAKPTEAPSEPSIPVSQVKGIVDAAVDAAVKAALAVVQQAQTPAAPVNTVETPVAQATVSTPVPIDGKLYGNTDTKKQIDLRTILPHLAELPNDKVTIVIQGFLTNAKGVQIEDESARRIQFIDPDVFERNSKPNEDTGKSLYDAMFTYVVVNRPAA